MSLFPKQPWWQPYAELLFWIVVAMGLMMFSAYHPSADDAIKAVVIGTIIAAWSQVTSKITEMRTQAAVQKEERERAKKFLHTTLTDRIGEPITKEVVADVSKEIAADDNASDFKRP